MHQIWLVNPLILIMCASFVGTVLALITVEYVRRWRKDYLYGKYFVKPIRANRRY